MDPTWSLAFRGFSTERIVRGSDGDQPTVKSKPGACIISVDGRPVLTAFMADPGKGLAACLHNAADDVLRHTVSYPTAVVASLFERQAVFPAALLGIS